MTLSIAHRGASGYEPENTLASIAKTIELGSDMVSIDVHTTKDKVPVVIHDDSVDRTTDISGRIQDLTLKEIQSAKVVGGGFIPTLKEMLDMIDGKIDMDIEIKSFGCAECVMKIIKGYKHPESVIISSFVRSELDVCRTLDGLARLAPISRFLTDDIIQFADAIHAYSLHLHYFSLDKEAVQKIHSHGIKVFAWTVNEISDINKMKEIGVDGIISDFPDRVK